MNGRMAEFDVALSFSREDQAVARELERRLTLRRVKVFSYQGRPEETLGHELDERLREVFSATPIVIVLVSASWDGPKTRLELEAALSGAAAKTGLVPARIDLEESRLPESLRSRTHYDLSQGTEGLVDAVARTVGRGNGLTERDRAWAALATTSCGAAALSTLGFRDLTRAQDLLLWLAAGTPIALLGLGVALRRRAARRSGARTRLQTRFEAARDSAERFVLHALALLLICTLAVGAHTWREVRAEHAVRASLSRDFDGLRRALHEAVAKVDTLATRATTLGAPEDQPKAAELCVEYEAALSGLRSARDALIERVRDQAALPPEADWKSMHEAADALVRTADTYFGYQIRELAKPPAPRQSSELVRSARAGKVRTLSTYRELWNQTFEQLEAAGSALQQSLNEHVERHAARWVGIVER